MSITRGLTHHYELRDDGMYVVWGADFPSDSAGSRKLSLVEAAGALAMGGYVDARLRARVDKGAQEGVS